MKRILATVLVLMMMVGCASISAAESYDIVFIPKGVADFWSIVAAGFEQAAKDAGMDCRVIYPTKEEAAVQVDLLYDVINSQPDAIVLSPVMQIRWLHLARLQWKKTFPSFLWIR